MKQWLFQEFYKEAIKKYYKLVKIKTQFFLNFSHQSLNKLFKNNWSFLGVLFEFLLCDQIKKFYEVSSLIKKIIL